MYEMRTLSAGPLGFGFVRDRLPRAASFLLQQQQQQQLLALLKEITEWLM